VPCVGWVTVRDAGASGGRQGAAPRRTDLMVCGALVVVVFGVYRAAFAVGFLNEDFSWLWRCRLVAPTTAWALLTRDVMGGLYSWRPVLQLAFGLNEALWGVHVFGYRLEALAWQALAAGLVYAIVARIADPLRGAVAAVLFGVHPVHVESLSWTCACGGPISTALLLLSLRGYLAWRQDEGRRPWMLAGVLVPFVLATATLETSIVFIGVVFAAELFLPAPAVRLGARLQLYVGLSAVAAGYLWLRHSSSPASTTMGMVGLDLRWPATMPQVAAFSLRKLLVVAGMLSTLDGQPVWCVAVVTGAGALAAGLCWWRGRGLGLWGLSWIVVAGAPFTLALLGPAPRHLHLAAVGFGLLCAELAASGIELVARRQRQLALVCAVALMLLWLGRMVLKIDQQTSVFVERGRLADGLLADLQGLVPQPRPGSELAFYGLGTLRAERGVFVYGLDDAVRLLYDDGSLRVRFGTRGDPSSANYHLSYDDGRLVMLAKHG